MAHYLAEISEYNFVMRMINPAEDKSATLAQEIFLPKKLFFDELKCMYWAEKKSLDLLLRLIKAASTHYLEACFKGHLLATKDQVVRLEQMFKLLNKKPVAKKCEIMNAFILEASAMIRNTKKYTLPRDISLIDLAQKIELFEINQYTRLLNLSNGFRNFELLVLLKETLTEEQEAEETFGAVKEDTLNDELFKPVDEIQDDETEDKEEELVAV